MRGERSGGRRDPMVKAQQAGSMQEKTEGPPTLQALADLVRLVGRSGAPQLRLRLVSAVGLTLAGKALGVLAPLMLGAAVNRLAAGQGAAVAVGWGFAAFAVGWAIVRRRHWIVSLCGAPPPCRPVWGRSMRPNASRCWIFWRDRTPPTSGF